MPSETGVEPLELNPKWELPYTISEELEGQVDWDDSTFQGLLNISCFLNPFVPWSSEELAKKATASLNNEAALQYFELFLQEFKKHTLRLANQKMTKSGYRNYRKPAVGLRPHLGHQLLAESDLRLEWKSKHLHSLSMVCFFMLPGTDFAAVWPTVSAFILNVLDDSDPLFRAQGCYLVERLYDSGYLKHLYSSGLYPVFKQSVETSLSYIPRLTPPDLSLHVLSAAYSAMYKMVSEILELVEIAEKHLMGSITHIHGRGNDRKTIDVLIFLFTQLDHVIEKMGDAVFICFTRLVHLTCLILVDPFIVDVVNGIDLVRAILRVQKTMIDRDDVYSYKFDFLLAWAIVKRLSPEFEAPIAENQELLGRYDPAHVPRPGPTAPSRVHAAGAECADAGAGDVHASAQKGHGAHTQVSPAGEDGVRAN